MDLLLQDKTALVTGSTAGIGFAIANRLAMEGATVIINGRYEERVAEAISKIKKTVTAAKLISHVADLSTKEGADSVIKTFKTLDILINNLGIYQVKNFEDITDEEWFHIFNTNVMSGVRLSRHYLPFMIKQNFGRIIFISSESGNQIPVEMIHYGVTKTAQIALARGLAEMTIGTNVTVNSVLPGPTKSEGVSQFINSMAKERKTDEAQIEKEFFNTVRPTSLLKRFETADEIANIVCFFCSPLAIGTNGAAIRAEGGVIRAIL